MNYFKRLIDFILFGNIYVALGTVCLIQSSIIQLQISDHLIPYSFLSFFATLFVYNFQRVFYKSPLDKNLNSIRRKWIFRNQITIKLLTLTGFTGVVLITVFFFYSVSALLYLSPLLLLSLLYFLPFIKLRKNPWLKLLTLVFVWTTVTAVIPLLLTGSELFSSNNLLHIFLRFCFMVAICIPFDIRDLQIDKADSISTIAQLLSETTARWLAFGFMLLYMVLIAAEYTYGILSLKVFAALILSAVISTGLVLMANSKRSEYFFVAGIDGTMILQGGLLILVHLNNVTIPL